MTTDVKKPVAAFERMTVTQLRHRYAEVFRENTNANNKAWLVKRIVWRLQALPESALGGSAMTR